MGTFYNAPFSGHFHRQLRRHAGGFPLRCARCRPVPGYDSIFGTNTTPSHAFNATFNVNSAYSFTVASSAAWTALRRCIKAPLSAQPLLPRRREQHGHRRRHDHHQQRAVVPHQYTFVDFSVYVPSVQAADP